MRRRILIGIDNTRSSVAAQRLGIRWAKRLGAEVAGIAVIDDPGMRHSEEAMLGRRLSSARRGDDGRGSPA